MTLNRRELSKAARHLAERDRDLRAVLRTHGPPPLWARKPGFRTLIQIILEQQVSLASARAVLQRLARDVVPFTPGRFVELGVDHLRALGVTRQKAAYCVHLADAVQSGRFDLRAIARMDDAAVRSALTSLKGVGPWTADIYLLMALRRPDVWPSGDIALVQAVRRVKGLRNQASPERVARIADSWRPFRSVAARMMWQHYLAERSKPAS
jgi:DNA-3-methyladenine glycosylase II